MSQFKKLKNYPLRLHYVQIRSWSDYYANDEEWLRYIVSNNLIKLLDSFNEECITNSKEHVDLAALTLDSITSKLTLAYHLNQIGGASLMK